MSNNKPKAAIDEAPWEAYEMASIDAAIPQGNHSDADFVSLHIETQDDTVFTPFEGYEGRMEDENHAKGAIDTPKESIADQEQEGYEKGFAQGEKDGYELGLQRGEKVVDNIEKMLGDISGLRADILRQYESDILDVVYAIAEKITHVQLETNHQIVNETIIKTIHQATEKHTLTLRINPEDLDFVEKLRPELFETFKAMKSIMVNADSSIQRGGCLLETPCGDIDAGIDTQLEKVSQCLRNAFSDNTND